MINFYGEIHPEYVNLVRRDASNLAFLIKFARHVLPCLDFSERELFNHVVDNIESGSYDSDVSLYDSRIDDFYSGLRDSLTGNDVLLLEGVLQSVDNVASRLNYRGLNSSLFKQVALIDRPGRKGRSDADRERDWLIPVKKYASEGFNVFLIAGAVHVSDDSYLMRHIDSVIPGVKVNRELMTFDGYTQEFIKDCIEFYNLIYTQE